MLRLSAAAKSNPIRYDGPVPLVIFKPDPQAKGGRVPLASIALPPGNGRLLIMLAPGGTQNGVELYQAAVVDDDPTTMPPGSLRFINYTGKAVSAQIGNEVVNLAKGPSKAYPVAKGNEPTEVMVQIASQEATGFVRAYSAKFRIKREERLTYILLPSEKPDGQGIKVLQSRDVVSLPPTPAK